MFRPVSANLDGAAKLGYLEHLIRVSTSEEEAQEQIDSLPPKVSSKISAIRQSFSDNVYRLEDRLLPTELAPLPSAPMAVIMYVLNEAKLIRKAIEPEIGLRWPLMYVFSADNYMGIMYTPEMTYLDRYDPGTGKVKVGIMSQMLVDSICPSLYHVKTRNTISVQTEINLQDVFDVSEDGEETKSPMELTDGRKTLFVPLLRKTIMKEKNKSTEVGRLTEAPPKTQSPPQQSPDRPHVDFKQIVAEKTAERQSLSLHESQPKISSLLNAKNVAHKLRRKITAKEQVKARYKLDFGEEAEDWKVDEDPSGSKERMDSSASAEQESNKHTSPTGARHDLRYSSRAGATSESAEVLVNPGKKGPAGKSPYEETPGENELVVKTKDRSPKGSMDHSKHDSLREDEESSIPQARIDARPARKPDTKAEVPPPKTEIPAQQPVLKSASLKSEPKAENPPPKSETKAEVPPPQVPPKLENPVKWSVSRVEPKHEETAEVRPESKNPPKVEPTAERPASLLSKFPLFGSKPDNAAKQILEKTAAAPPKPEPSPTSSKSRPENLQIKTANPEPAPKPQAENPTPKADNPPKQTSKPMQESPASSLEEDDSYEEQAVFPTIKKPTKVADKAPDSSNEDEAEEIDDPFYEPRNFSEAAEDVQHESDVSEEHDPNNPIFETGESENEEEEEELEEEQAKPPQKSSLKNADKKNTPPQQKQKPKVIVLEPDTKGEGSEGSQEISSGGESEDDDEESGGEGKTPGEPDSDDKVEPYERKVKVQSKMRDECQCVTF